MYSYACTCADTCNSLARFARKLCVAVCVDEQAVPDRKVSPLEISRRRQLCHGRARQCAQGASCSIGYVRPYSYTSRPCTYGAYRRNQPAARVHLFSKRAGATSLRQDYLQIAEGVKNGSLRPLEPAAQPVLWNQTNQRFSNHPLNMCSSMSFGEPFDARMRTSASYSFGNCSRNDAKLVYDQARRRLRRAAAPRPDACIVCRRRRSKSARWGSRRGHRPPTQSRASSGPSPRSPTRRRPVPSWEPTRATARS